MDREEHFKNNNNKLLLQRAYLTGGILEINVKETKQVREEETARAKGMEKPGLLGLEFKKSGARGQK